MDLMYLAIFLITLNVHVESAVPNFTTLFDFRPLSLRREKNLTQSLPIYDFTTLVTGWGYLAEEYKIVSVDGYVLTLHRIPGSRTRPKAPGKPVVYIQHGLLSSSDTFILGGPQKDLVYLLVDAGYDIWLGNLRGNTYSRAHIKLSPDYNPEFWDFSFHEMALRDTSLMIDYALRETNRRSLIYVAHSMGTTVGLVLLSAKPEYNQKIDLVINLATIGNWKKPRNIMKFFYYYGHYIRVLLETFGVYEIFPQSLGLHEITQFACSDGSIFQKFCLDVTQFITGTNPDLLDTKRLATALSYFPAGASRKSLVHYLQNIIAGKLQWYDYGTIRNYARYGQTKPPAYNLQNVEVPVFMIYGKGDAVAGAEDSIELARVLKNARAEPVPHAHFNHLDFVWARNVKHLLHDRVVGIIKAWTISPRSLYEL